MLFLSFLLKKKYWVCLHFLFKGGGIGKSGVGCLGQKKGEMGLYKHCGGVRGGQNPQPISACTAPLRRPVFPTPQNAIFFFSPGKK